MYVCIYVCVYILILRPPRYVCGHYRLHIYPRVGSFTYPGIDTRQKEPTAFSVSSEAYRQCEVNEVA